MPDTLVLFTTYLALVKGLSVGSISNYLAGIRQEHLRSGYDLPTPTTYFPLKTALQGAKRFLSRPVRQKLPISPALLSRLVAATGWGSVWRCLLLTLWVTFSQLASLVPTVGREIFSPNHHLAWQHLSFRPDSVKITLVKTKTIQCSERRLTFVVPRHSNPSFCLLTHLLAWQTASPAPFLHHPVFVLPAHQPHCAYTPVNRRLADAFLKAALEVVGADVTRYSWSSFRRGSATSYYLASGDVESLRVHGDWCSQAYTRYLSLPATARVGVVSTVQSLLK